MGFRRDAREKAVQFLFQHDFNPVDLEKNLTAFWALETPSDEIQNFANDLIRGALTHRDESDARIQQYCKNWEIGRIAAVDRNIMRLAVYEMLHRDDIPPVVSINEAVDIAKKFSTSESGRFVNGILDQVKKDITRPHRSAAGGQEQDS